ncbi:hypothetical protein [uncultured Jatrophihabitans sp.]|uniref:hypothetical protein n=1 Tax=uncultured Jatrophihabitans sp. TaxID=1610747 RepID=UPI0035CBC6D4
MTDAHEHLRIIQIVNDREVAISGGAEAGISGGDTLLIQGRPVDIRDPETNEVLGQVVQTKAVVKAYDVKERFALARTFRSRRVNVGGGGGINSISRMFDPPKWETRTETLRRSPQAGDPLLPDESVVEVGDRVEKFTGSADDVPSSSVWR